MRRSQIVSLLLAILIGFGSLAGVLAAGWAPVLGVQLQGGVEVLLRPTAPADDEQLDQAIEIIRSRVDALGVAEPDITRQGEQVVVQLPGVKDKQRAVDLVGQTAELRFRPVLLTFNPLDETEFRNAMDLADAYNGVVDDAADAAADPFADTLSDSPADQADGPPQTVEPSETVEPAPPESDDPAAEDASAGDAAVAAEPAEDAETADVDAGTDAAGVVSDDGGAADDEASAAGDDALADDGTADADAAGDNGEAPEAPQIEVEVEEPLAWTQQENDEADQVVVLPDRRQPVGYVLGPAELTGEAVSEAAATFNNEWVVNVELTDEGAVGFDEIAARYYGQQVGIVLDGLVESAPVIRATEFGGTAVISGDMAEEESRDLAVALRFGALPVEFEQDDVRTVSATLGEGTLRAGAVAGIVGLIAVGVYMLLYYRLLGLVAVASLAISGSVLWSLISWLGESRGLALTLAGATGIIVSIGVQVDSNIVYYERVKEEVRRGRAVRSAADASFKAAFSTIVWADLASLIGAGVLYQLTSGTVRGFALYLGLATLIDLAVSYFFMRPLVVFVARRLVREQPRRLGVLPGADDAPAAAPLGGVT